MSGALDGLTPPTLGLATPKDLTSSQDVSHSMESFDWMEYLEAKDPTGELMSTTDGRHQLTREDPLLFALIYLSDLISDETGLPSFSLAHLEWFEHAKSWMTKGAKRDAYVAPRGLGKSTIFFNVLPLWAAAFGHIKYLSAFSASANQAWSHLANFKRQLDNNELLRDDFPDLCKPLTRPRNSKPVADRESRYVATNGFVFDADGIDAAVAGKNVNGVRPDFILLDDIEPDGENYSADLKAKQLNKVLNNIFYLNVAAKVVISGTVTMVGSIIHDLVRSLTEDAEQWISDTRPAIDVHHHLPIIEHPDGSETSVWPGNPDRFDLATMQANRSTPDFMLNYMNLPIAGEGALWLPTFFKYGTPEDVGGLLLSIDPAVTSKRSSDFTALALIGYSKTGKCAVVVDAWQLKRTPEEIRSFVLDKCEGYPVARVLVETNQGGDVWKSILHDLPVPLVTVHQNVKKEVRAARIATVYNRGQVWHAKKISHLEAQMMSFPKVTNDDLVDAVCSGVAYFLDGIKAKRQAMLNPVRQGSYL